MGSLHSFETRKINNGAQEETVGIPKEGFFDPDGEFPTEGYKGESSINKSARGSSINSLDTGGSDQGTDLSLSEQQPSVYPYNQVQETSSGHIIEVDDTVGSERVLVKHRTGAGLELKADGTVIVVAKKNLIEVTGSNHTAIIEGNGKLIYKGTLDLDVTGDFNLNVGGDYNLRVDGQANNTYMHSVDTTIIQDENVNVKGSSTKYIQDDMNLYVGSSYTFSAEQNYNVNANNCTVSFNTGAIGGSQVDFTGDTSTCSTFHGDLDGCAKEALDANSALEASRAGTAAAIGAGGSGTGGHSVTDTSRQYSPSVSIEDVDLDTPYVDVANHPLTIDEVRSKLRDPSNMSNSVFTNAMVQLDILNPNFNQISVPNTNRRTGKTPTARKGETAIGNTPPTFDNKRFIP